MDLETFLALEKERLRYDEEQIKEKLRQARSLEADEQQKETSSKEVYNEPVKDTQPLATSETTTENANVPTTTTISTAEVANSAQAMTKTTKEWVNQKEFFADNLKSRGKSKRKNEDDMEQWVSDTFYSYFPGYNNEYQKRQNYLRDRQREHQENFLKHQLMNASPAKPKHEKPAPSQSSRIPNIDTARSSNSHMSTDKTDLEIIVNNPNYVPPRHNSTARPGSTRHKLLQDLEHTELSYILGGDAVMERKRRSVESETSRKQDYQRELMQQIEEKRRSIELIREKERRQEEVLTKRLQDQLKTIQLEEQLEKEKLRVEKLRYESEQNRVMRAHLLAKLENDSKLLYTHDNSTSHLSKKPAAHTDTAKSTDTADNNNKVYKYFSNSARHEYRRGQPLPADIELSLDIPEIRHTERECFHLSEKVCPFCDAPLRSYESCCLRCQRKIAVRINSKPANGKESSPSSDSPNNKEDAEEERCENEENCLQSFSLVCVKCERLYALCSTCLAKNDVCRACHRKKSVCMNCRRTLCASCLEEISCGRDTERSHINDQDSKVTGNQIPHIKADSGSERSFKVLEVNYEANQKENDASFETSPTPKTIHNNLQSVDRPPYSMNIERNSIFHPDYQTSKQNTTFETLPKLLDKQLSFNLDTSPRQEVDDYNIERVRKETDKRLSRYLKNYGDLASYRRSKSEARNRSTQTTPESIARRDVVLNEGNNLSMPLLREMPKMTRHEGKAIVETAFNKRSKIDNLKRRWEIPAVQKFSISPNSPRILTQVGAIRKQLQADRLFAEND